MIEISEFDGVYTGTLAFKDTVSNVQITYSSACKLDLYTTLIDEFEILAKLFVTQHGIVCEFEKRALIEKATSAASNLK